jgi:hypothetical protein
MQINLSIGIVTGIIQLFNQPSAKKNSRTKPGVSVFFARSGGHTKKAEATRMTAIYRMANPTTLRFSVYIVTFFMTPGFKC